MTNHPPISRSIPLSRFLAPLLSVCVLADVASAGLSVSNTNDSGTGSLRQNLIDAEGLAGFDTIGFDPPLDGQTITLLSPIIIASDQVGIDASALNRGVIISGGGTVRIFQVNSSAALNLNRLHLTRGNAGANGGGAILTTGNMVITDCTFTENAANSGGAVFADGPGSLTLQRSTFSNNAAGDSGALWIQGTHSVILSNSTITLNRSTSAGGTGAITVFGGSLNVTHSTISANAGDTFGGGIFTQAGLSVERSIVAANTATGGAPADIFKGAGGTVGAIGPSLIGSNQSVTMEFTAAPPLVGTAAAPIDPKLGPLGNTGGPTRTLAPKYDSPALNAAMGSGVATDQRGFPRGVGLDSTLDSDLGSVERGPLVTVTNANDATAGSLRAAIAAATAPDTRIQFAAPALNGATITLTSDQLFVNGKSVEFDASTLPSGLTISGNNARRVLLVDSSGALSLNRITIAGGNDGFGGAGLGVQGGGRALALDCTLQGNISSGPGGAIFATSAIVDLHRCTISGNTAGSGGAISQQGLSQLSLTNCTVAGNQSAGSNGTGGLRCMDGTLNLVHTTITGNTGSNFAGGLFVQSPAVVRIERCLIAGNFDPFPEKDIYRLGGTIIPVGNNLIGINNSVAAEFPTNSLHGTSSMPLDAKLAPLGLYGGRTQTVALRPSSPAREQGTGSITVIDQRSLRRPVGTAADLGAYEAGTFANFAAWSEETAGTALSATGDNDLDSAKNLLEYALRRNALVPDAQLSPAFSKTFNGLADAHLFSFRYQSAARDLRYVIQRNSGLPGAWENVATIDLRAGTNTGDPGLVINPALEMISFMDPPPDTDPAPAPRNFYRLQVELVP